MKDKTLCIINKCERKRVSRGLCQTCIATARRYIIEGKATWEFLEKNGMSLSRNIGFFNDQFLHITDKFVQEEGNEKWRELGN